MKCLNCQEEIKSKFAKRFCCKSCAAVYNNQKFPKRSKEKLSYPKCRTCDNKVEYRYNFHCRECRSNNKHLKNGPVDSQTIEFVSRRGGANRYDLIRTTARRVYRDMLTNPRCEKCGYDKHTELCHIKPIASFPKDTLVSVVNRRNNIMFLCPNCHWEFDHCL
jgi:hypothetical protein